MAMLRRFRPGLYAVRRFLRSPTENPGTTNRMCDGRQEWNKVGRRQVPPKNSRTCGHVVLLKRAWRTRMVIENGRSIIEPRIRNRNRHQHDRRESTTIIFLYQHSQHKSSTTRTGGIFIEENFNCYYLRICQTLR